MFGSFYFEHWLACNPNYANPMGSYWNNNVWRSAEDHREKLVVVHGDSSAKVHPWDAVKKDPTAPWWDFDYTFWGAIQDATR